MTALGRETSVANCLQIVLTVRLALPAETLTCLELIQNKVVVEQQDTIGTDDSRGMNGTVLKPAADGRGRHGERRSNLFLAVQDPLLLLFGHVTQRGLLNRAAYEVEQLLARHVDNALVKELLDDIFVFEMIHAAKLQRLKILCRYYRTSRVELYGIFATLFSVNELWGGLKVVQPAVLKCVSVAKISGYQ